MKRLFIAITLPEVVVGRLLDLKSPVPGLRWTPRSNLHLTLCFIGEVSDEHLAVFKKALSQVRSAPLNLHVDGLGIFARPGRNILWAGFAHPAPLLALQREVERRLKNEAGLRVESGRYFPHITLARMKDGSIDELKRFAQVNSSRVHEHFLADSFTLFSSVLSAGGARHFPESVYPMKS